MTLKHSQVLYYESVLILLNYMNDNILCSVVIRNNLSRKKYVYMKTPEETIEILTKEIESLNSIEAHDLVLFYYKINHQHFNITTYDKFSEFLESFDKNPFKLNDDKTFKKQLAESLIACTTDYMSLITAVELIKCKFSVQEIINHYYSSMNVFDNDLF